MALLAFKTRSAGRFRALLLRGTSGGACAMVLATTPAQAQLANLGGALGHVVNLPVAAAAPSTRPTQAVSPTMVQIAARHAEYKARVSQQADIVANANAAARAAAAAAQQTIANGLASSGLKAVDVSRQNTSALTVWVGAEQPTESAPATPTPGVTVQVDVKQTQARALLSWESFNVGRETLLNFDQQGQKDWVVVNRVVGGIDPTTGRLDTSRSLSPTQILGRIKADGTVYVLDRAGVLFGATAQVNLRSLVVSTLELGRTIIKNPDTSFGQPATVDLSLDAINSSFLQSGILPSDHVGLLGSISGETHGAVTVATGAQIRSTGGFVILAAPKVTMAGEINAPSGSGDTATAPALGTQVSLVAGNYVDVNVSTGSADSIDPYVRGLVLSSQGGGTIDMGGSINAPQGYISLVTDATGTVNVGGILTSTTSVARNGKISLIGGSVNLGTYDFVDVDGNPIFNGSGVQFRSTATLSITPDLSGATIPQAADSVAAFKTSQIDIGNYDVEISGAGFAQLQTRSSETVGRFVPTLLPTLVDIGGLSTIYAPSANVNIGGLAGGDRYIKSDYIGIGNTGITIGADAIIDVSGLDNVEIAASRNQLEISPTKKNELRDTPVYRDPTTDGSFTLNGATLYVDPRLSGVRDDGVAWVGSPLIEAGSLADQIGVTAQELMTKGGNVTLATMGIDANGLSTPVMPNVTIAPTARIDFSGGWVNYQAGTIRTSKLVTADGRVVDIGAANPNDVFVGIVGGFVESLPQLSTPRVYSNPFLDTTRTEEAYSEGRDAGSLNIFAPTASFNARLSGDAVAGARQILAGEEATAASRITGDPRLLQAANGQLPSAGLLRYSTNLGGSVLVGGTASSLPDGSAAVTVGANQVALTAGMVHLLDSTVNDAGLAALRLETSGSVIFASGSTIDLAAGGALGVRAGRAISFNGKISVPAGRIDAVTYGNRLGDLFDAGDDLAQTGILSGATPAWLAVLDSVAAPDAGRTGWFDIRVNAGATLSARGRWTNDLLVTDGLYGGRAFTSGGAISLTSAPHIVAFADSDAKRAIDLSGSIILESGSLLDVSGGGFVSRTGELDLSGQGGDVTLTNNSSYFQLEQTDGQYTGSTTGPTLFNVDLTTFQLVPVNSVGYDSAIVPDELTSRVDIADGTIRGFGFEGGGTFTLTTPDLDFGNSGGTGTAIPLSFLADTGFATLDLSAWNTTLIDNVFDNGRTGKTALLSTEIVTIGSGETLDLTQWVLPSILTVDQIATLRAQTSGTDVSLLADFAPTTTPGDFGDSAADYYERAAHLVLGGLTELNLLDGTITGAAGASITVPKLYQAGTIDIRGGTITQREILPASYVSPRAAIGVGQQLDGAPVDPVAALAAVFGLANADGKYSETAFSADPRFSTVTNRDLVGKAGSDRQIYYLGRLAQDEGIVFATGSTTDLSGAVLLDPLASISGAGQIRSGRLVDGGSITAVGDYLRETDLFDAYERAEDNLSYRTLSDSATNPFTPGGLQPARKIMAAEGASIDISGASGIFDILVSGNRLAATTVWSNGGQLTGLGGGDVTSATIAAAGGAPGASGGVFDWYNPVLRQNGESAVPEDADLSRNNVFADQLMASGFDSFVARGLLTTLGDVDLTLGRSFILKSPESLGIPDSNSFGYYSSRISGTGDLSITAPHILLSSIQQFVLNLPERAQGRTGDHSLTLRAQGVNGIGSSFDIVGAIGIDAGFSDVTLSAQGDLRLTGVQPIVNTLNPEATLQVPSLSGGIIAAGRLEMQARTIYATTGTGNLLRDPKISGDNISSYTGPFLIASLAQDLSDSPTVTFRSEPGTTPVTPYSAGSYIRVLGENILQGGALYAPVGRIDLGSRTAAGLTGFISGTITTKTLTLANGSITSVSGNGLKIPYGTTTDLTEHFFLPTLTAPLTSLPAAELGLSAANITTEAGATVDVSGGGNLYGYEFVSGTGGSRDVLSRYNNDAYSSNNGYQYSDGRQVYAILPADSPQLAALYDPVYSEDYAALYGSEVGKSVTLDAVPESAPGANDGLAAGTYILLPAKYALLPGAMRLVEQPDAAAPLVGNTARQIDGTLSVGGVVGIAGTNIVDPLRRSFSVQSQAVFTRYSQIVAGDVADKIATEAAQSNLIVPRLPNDAARIVIDPESGLTIGNRFDTTARTSGTRVGRGSQVDILGDIINIVSSDDNAASTGVTILTESLANLNAASLMIGGRRTELADGSTAVTVTASEIHVRNFNVDPLIADQTIALSAPELIFAVNGPSSVLDIASNAVLSASGPLVDTRAGNYDLTSVVPGTQDRASALGSFLRLANGPERFVSRVGTVDPDLGRDRSELLIGAATLSGQSMTLDTSRHAEMDAANLLVDKIALSADGFAFSTRTFGVSGFIISPELEAKLAAIGQVTLISPTAIAFTPGVAEDGTPAAHQFRNLVIDAPGIRALRPTADRTNTDPLAITINAANVALRNRFDDLGACTASGVLSCGSTGNSLIINASGALTLGPGTFRTYGFESKISGASLREGSVSVTAAAGTYYTGTGSLELGNAAFSLTTPFIVELGTDAVPKEGALQPNYAINTVNSVTIAAPAGATIAAPQTPLAPGARFAIGSIENPAGSLAFADGSLVKSASLTITDTLIRATAGTIDLVAQNDLTIGGTATLATPSYKRTFGADGDPDQVTVSASGGAVSLVAKQGDIGLGAQTRVAIGGSSGGGGSLALYASQGMIGLGGTIDAGAPDAGASFAFDAGASSFDVGDFVQRYGAQFTGRLAIRTGIGNLALDAGSALRLASLTLVADGGTTSINRTINTSGVNGGDIALYGRDGVALGATAVLDTRSTGYAVTDTRQARAGNITLGTGDFGSVSVAAGARLELGVARLGARLVPKAQIDPATGLGTTSYTLVEGDIGGTLTLRAPVIEQPGADTVNVTFAGSVAGASEVSLVGYRRYDLAALAEDPTLSGISVTDVDGDGVSDVAALDPSASGKNFLTDELSDIGIPHFIQNFDISGAYTGLGVLPTLGETFHARPGIDIDFAGEIVLASSWNLGAGRITDYAAASAGSDPDLVLSPFSTIVGSDVYEVAAGKEAHLFQNYVHMLYRTGTGVNTSGEAGVFTVRAGGNLRINGSITDGFFNFADQTDANYLDYQLGGGTLFVQPTFQFQCGANDCANLVDFDITDGSIDPESPRAVNSITINLGAPKSTLIELAAPYSDSANAASAASRGTDGGGNPYGAAALFPLLADGSAAASSDIQLVGGAGAVRSANPLHIDRGSNGSVIISGETSYTLETPDVVTPIYAGGSLLNRTGLDAPFDAGELTAAGLAEALDLDLDDDPYSKATRISFGNASKVANSLLIELAEAFVAAHPGEASMTGPARAPTGMATTLALAAEFLNSSNALQLLAQALEGEVGTGVGNRFTGKDVVSTRTLVRTGTGSIEIAAGADIDLTNGPAVLRNKSGAKTGSSANPVMQLGGAAVYTAGHRVSPGLVSATVAGTDDVLRVDPTAYLPSDNLYKLDWRPDETGQLQANPVFATGGGSISLDAGNDVLGRRDVWNEGIANNNADMIGSASQRWRVGQIGANQDALLASTYIRVNPQQFNSGIATLGGGNVAIRAGGDLSDMTIALDTTLASADIGDSFGAMIFGGGNLDIYVGGNIGGGRFDISTGRADIQAGGDIGGLGYLGQLPDYGQDTIVNKNVLLRANLPEIRLTDAEVTLRAGGSITLAKVGALGLDTSNANSQGYLTGNSALKATSYGDFTLTGGDVTSASAGTRVLPATLEVTSLGGDIDLGGLDNFLYPGARGQLSLLAAGTLRATALNLDDGDPSYLPGLYSVRRIEPGNALALTQGRNFGMPGIFPNSSDGRRRLFHNAVATHGEDEIPARIVVGGSLINLSVYSAKQMRISAGEDILNMIFFGQNLSADDTTRIVAGRDITGSSSTTNATAAGTSFTNGRKVLQGNYFALGGPGSLFIEAGRDLGPFLNSATISSYLFQMPAGTSPTSDPQPSIGFDSYAGGILAVGNDFNPWLAPKSADIYAFFGVANGMDFDALRERYLNPANFDALPGDLFEQKDDGFGNESPDRTKPIYAPVLVAWMKANHSAALLAAYGTSDVTIDQAYSAFAALPTLVQRRFLLDEVYFDELAAPSDPAGTSFQQYARGYLAVETLFSSERGYSAAFEREANGDFVIDPETLYPVRLNEAVIRNTGNLDLRLATIETTRNSNVTLLGPGGDALLGSIVRTSAQAAGLAYQPQIFGTELARLGSSRPKTDSFSFQVRSIPTGYEGILTLRGGFIHSFTDGDLRLNQSRLFSQQSGDVVLWSSNGDLNAGQGPKSAANVPPIVLRFNPDGGSEVDSAGAVVGAGIAGFAGIRRLDPLTGNFELVSVLDDPDVAQAEARLALLPRASTVTINGKTYQRDVPSIFLMAPEGTVDAGDAGVRAAGDIFVAAAQVSNSDNFKVGGSSVGVPALSSAAAPSLPSSAASALVANVFSTNPTEAAEQRSRIFVDVLGYFASADQNCLDADGKPIPNCSPN
jgi:filamentous hemagglutinin family protein